MVDKIKTLVIDGNFALKRVYHANTIDDKYDKGSMGIAYSFITALRSITKQLNPNKIIVFWDAPNGGLFRYYEYKDYKANRYGKDWSKKILTEAEAVQFNEEKMNLNNHKQLTSSVLQNLLVRQCEVDGHEADDLIANYIKRYNSKEDITLFTNDNDLLQVSTIGAKVIIGRQVIRDDNEGSIYIPQGVNGCANILGYHPKNISLVKAFCGDTSDNIIGARGCTENKLLSVVDLNSDLNIDSIYSEIEKSHSEKPLQWKMNVLLRITNPLYVALNKIPVKKEKSKDIVNILGKYFSTDLKLRSKTWENLTFYQYLVKLSKDLEKCKELLYFVIEKSSLNLCDYNLNYRLCDLIKRQYINDEGKEEVELMGEAHLPLDHIGSKHLQNIFTSSDYLMNFRYIRKEDRYPQNEYFKLVFKEYCQPFIDTNIKYEKQLFNLISNN